jgi:hypothetical protein
MHGSDKKACEVSVAISGLREIGRDDGAVGE